MDLLIRASAVRRSRYASSIAMTLVLISGVVAPSHGLPAAEAVTGTIVGRVTDAATGRPISGADVSAASASGRYRARTGDVGTYALLGVSPDTYTLALSARGFDARAVGGVTVLPGSRVNADAALTPALHVIGSVAARAERGGIATNETQDVYRIVGDAARGPATASSSGLGSYTRGSVQGAVAAVPGIQQDQFANVILQGGKVEDTVFSYDGVPVPQALIAEPGGNVIGAQLPTTGLGYTTVTTGGLSSSSNQALGGVIDEIPATGVFPAQGRLTLEQGLVPGARGVEAQYRWATLDLRERYALDTQLASEQIGYGDGRTFYPAEAATYGLSLSSRATWSVAANAHVRIGSRDDLSFSTLAGQAVYDQYGTPFSGLRYGTLDGVVNGQPFTFPAASSGDVVVTSPTRIRGTYAVQKLQDLRTYEHSTIRVQAYGSEFGSQTVAPFFDDLSYPNGVVSYFGGQNSALNGLGFDVQNIATERQEFTYGSEIRTQRSFLEQLVPTLGDRIASGPTLNSYLAYFSDRWRPTGRVALTATLRANGTHFLTSAGHRYGVSAIDPHLGLNYRFAPALSLLATYDHTSVAPLPLEAQRVSSQTAVPFVPLAPETGDNYEVSLQHEGALRLRLTYYAKRDANLIDVLPANFRSAISAGEQPATQVGVPTNAGNLLVHGLQLSAGGGPLSFNGTYTHGFSSSASQFGFNDLNAPAIGAGHLFPLGYVPDFSGSLTFRGRIGRSITLAPTLSYQSGYPYGNGKRVWIFDPVTNRPRQVANDNNVNPGYNYYFLRDPAQPFDAVDNPYTATLGTPEGDDPNTLRSTPQLLASLHIEAELSRKTTLLVDVSNLFGAAYATQYQGNPYLIGPPGYSGGNPLYAAYYGQPFGSAAYTLGNGVPTNDGQKQIVPWRYGTAAYVPSSYPNARAVYVRLQQRF